MGQRSDMSDDAVGLRRSLAERVARTAGAAALDFYRGRAALELEMKGRHDRVTEADRRVEALIRAKISGVFPHDEQFPLAPEAMRGRPQRLAAILTAFGIVGDRFAAHRAGPRGDAHI